MAIYSTDLSAATVAAHFAARITPPPTTTAATQTGTSLVITGTGFTGATAVHFGSTPATFTVNSDTQITATIPPGLSGTNIITVTTPGGTSAGQNITVLALPTVTSVVPGTPYTVGAGNPDPGKRGVALPVTIFGTGFNSTLSVHFGPNPCNAVFTQENEFTGSGTPPWTVISDTEIQCFAPFGGGTVDVTVTGIGGTSATSSADLYTYLNDLPLVTQVHPQAIPAASLVPINVQLGGGFFKEDVAGVHYEIYEVALVMVSPPPWPQLGSVPIIQDVTPPWPRDVTGVSTIPSDSLLTMVTGPRLPAGDYHVRVRGSNGSSAFAPANLLTVIPQPVVTAVAPVAGPVMGGNTVTITGLHLTGATGVQFGSAAATAVVVVNDTTVTCTVPPGVAGGVHVTVTTPGLTSVATAADLYTYAAIPVLSSLSPVFGIQAGLTPVTLTGSGLTGATSVLFGTVPATGVVVVKDTTITCLSPAGTTVVSTTVVTPGGTSNGLPFSYLSTLIPQVTSVVPNSAPYQRPVSVTVNGTGFEAPATASFGALTGLPFTVLTSTTGTLTLTLNGPPPNPGVYDITVTTVNGTSPVNAADRFTVISNLLTGYAVGGEGSSLYEIGSDAEFFISFWDSTTRTLIDPADVSFIYAMNNLPNITRHFSQAIAGFTKVGVGQYKFTLWLGLAGSLRVTWLGTNPDCSWSTVISVVDTTAGEA